ATVGVAQIIALKYSELAQSPGRLATVVQALHCKRKDTPCPFLFEIVFRRVNVGRCSQFVFGFLKVQRNMYGRAAALLAASITRPVHEEAVETAAKKSTQAAFGRIVRIEKILFQQ